MTQPWYTDPRMLAAGNVRARRGGESDLPQPGSAQAMPAPPSGKLMKPTEIVKADRDASPAFTRAFLAEAARDGLDPIRLARLYALAYARPQGNVRPPRRPSLLARVFARMAHR
jgi:hypothetical protein